MIKLVSIFILALLSPPLASTQTVYAWEDKNGVLHFSDFPESSNAKALALPEHEADIPPPTFEDLPTTTQNKHENQSNGNQPPEPLSLRITAPLHNQTIRSNSGSINISVEKSRNLDTQEQLQLNLNHRPYGAPDSTGKWQLQEMNRGTHTISIHALRDGKLIASSSSITVHLHRASIK
jgi:hypothetical protein